MTTPRSTSKMVTTRFSHLGASFAALAIVLGPVLPAGAESVFKFHGRFANRDGTPAAGELHARMAQSSSRMIVHAKGLSGSQTLSVILRGTGTDDASVASFTTDTRGRANLRFMTVPRRTTDLRLGFDPRGKHIVIIGGGADRLDVYVPGADDATEMENEMELEDEPTDVNQRPYGDDLPDPLDSRLEVRDATATPCSGTLRFSYASFPDDAGQPEPLPPPPPPPLASCSTVDTTDVSLVAETGSGKAKARFRRDAQCHRDFRVEVEDVTTGSYELCVGGMSFGSFDVVNDGVEVQGEIELEDQMEDVGARPYPTTLPDALGERIEVRRAGSTACSGTLMFSLGF